MSVADKEQLPVMRPSWSRLKEAGERQHRSGRGLKFTVAGARRERGQLKDQPSRLNQIEDGVAVLVDARQERVPIWVSRSRVTQTIDIDRLAELSDETSGVLPDAN
jgi:hypothetical protein